MMRRRSLASLAAVAVVAWAPLVHADTDDAAALLRQAFELRRDKRDAEAYEVLLRAVRSSPTPRALAQLGLCEQALGKWVDAERDVTAALKAQEDPWIAKNAAALDEARSVIERHLAWLRVEPDVEGASVTVDGVAITAGSDVRVTAGGHRIEVTAADRVSEQKLVWVGSSEHAALPIALSPIAPSPPPPVASAAVFAPEPPPARDRNPMGTVGPLALGGAGLVGIGVGTFYGLRAIHDKNERDAACVGTCTTASLAPDSDARSSANVSTVAFAVGLSLVAAGATWWFFGHRGGASAHVVPAVTAGSGGGIRFVF